MSFALIEQQETNKRRANLIDVIICTKKISFNKKMEWCNNKIFKKSAI